MTKTVKIEEENLYISWTTNKKPLRKLQGGVKLTFTISLSRIKVTY